MNRFDLIWRVILLCVTAYGIYLAIDIGATDAKSIVDYIKSIGIRITEFKLF